MAFWKLGALEQAELVRTGAASARELVDAAIERIERLDPHIRALVDTRFEQARAEAAGELPDGPFRGVPILIKDAVQYSAGDRYQHGTRFLRDRDFRPDIDSELVRRYKQAGFIVLGRTKVPEMTLSPTTEPLAHGPCHNPWNLDFMTGGSSGGSAAAVASGMVAVAHANDMGGSIRIPASCCGLVGLKPSRNRTSIAPYGECWGPLTHEHVVTRNVRDCAAVLDATAGMAPGDFHTAPPPQRPWLDEVGRELEPLRIGLMLDTPFSGGVDPQCRAATEQVARQLGAMGHAIEPVSGEPLGSTEGMAAMGTVVACGIASTIDRWETRFDAPVTNLEPATQAAVDMARLTSGQSLMGAIDRMADWSRRMAAAYQAYDLLLTPTLPTPPLRLGTIDPLQPLDRLQVGQGAVASFALPFDVTGQPAISLPVACSAEGLPIGVQIVARYGREDQLLRLAAILEREYAWEQRWPAIAG